MLIHWVLFFSAMLAILIRKLNIHRSSTGMTWKSASFDFFFGETSKTSKTFFYLFGYVVFAAWYLGELPFLGSPIPVHWSISLFLGGASEWLAPLVTDKLAGLISEKFASK